MQTPPDLDAGGRWLWESVTEKHELDAQQYVQLVEACRAKDRLDKLDRALRGDADTWMQLVLDANSDGHVYELRIANALVHANATANAMKQLLAAMRLPDEATGKRPQQRSARGAYGVQVPSGTVSSLERARARKSSS